MKLEFDWQTVYDFSALVKSFKKEKMVRLSCFSLLLEFFFSAIVPTLLLFLQIKLYLIEPIDNLFIIVVLFQTLLFLFGIWFWYNVILKNEIKHLKKHNWL